MLTTLALYYLCICAISVCVLLFIALRERDIALRKDEPAPLAAGVELEEVVEVIVTTEVETSSGAQPADVMPQPKENRSAGRA